jgi:DNA replication protein DnaC
MILPRVHIGLMEISNMEYRLLDMPTLKNSHQATLDQLEIIHAESLKAEQKKQQAERTEHLLQRVSPRYRGKTFDDFKIDHSSQELIKKTAIRFVETFEGRRRDGSCLKLLGNVGTGKTFIALIMYQALAKIGYSVHYESSLHFLRKIQDKNYESDSAFQGLLDYYKRIQFLIIDEATEGFGGKNGCLADWEKQLLFTLIDMRYHEELCTVVISNRNKQEMIERLGERTVDRLSENGITLAFNWNSYRQK